MLQAISQLKDRPEIRLGILFRVDETLKRRDKTPLRSF